MFQRRRLLILFVFNAASAHGFASDGAFCIGEHGAACPSNAQHFSCGNTVQDIEGTICPAGTEYRRTSLEQRGGNACGYNVVAYSCDPRPMPPAPALQTQPTHAAIRVSLDQTMDAKSVIQHMTDCTTSPSCVAVLRLISNATQVPVDKTFAAVATINKQREPGSETANFRFALPAGYRYCSSSMSMTSIVPYDGDRGSLFSSRALPNGVSAQTWTPVRSDGGRSWVEATIDVVGIRADLANSAYASGQCLNPGTGEGRLLYYCRGGGCVSTTDRGQDVAPTLPAANSANR